MDGVVESNCFFGQRILRRPFLRFVTNNGVNGAFAFTFVVNVYRTLLLKEDSHDQRVDRALLLVQVRA